MHERSRKPSPRGLSLPGSASFQLTPSTAGPVVSRASQLRRALGNQAVQSLGRALADSTVSAREPASPLGDPAPTIQAKLAVGSADDPLEEEAEATARLVASMPTPPQPKNCGCGGVCARCRGERSGGEPPGTLRMSSVSNAEPATDIPANVREALRASGQPLGPAERAFFEPRFQTSFDAVRVHTGPLADTAASELGALAFTAGSHIAFSGGQFSPGTLTGNQLIAHELTHVTQQRRQPGAAAYGPGRLVRRQPNPKSPSQLPDPISLADLPDFGFWAVGDDYTGVPQEADIRQVLGEIGIADVKALAESQPKLFKLKDGDVVYYAYAHPLLGVVARAYTAPSDATLKALDYSIYAYINGGDALKYRPVGGTGRKRKPIVTLDVMTGTPARFSDIYAALRIIEQRLAGLATRYPASDAAVGAPIGKAQVAVATFRGAVVASQAQLQTVNNALQLLEWADYDLDLIDKQRAKLVADQVPVISVDALRVRYGHVFEKLLDSGGIAAYGEAERWAERLPYDIVLDAMKAHGERNQGVLLPSDTLVAWAVDLRKRIDDLDNTRQLLAAKPGDPTLTKQVRDEATFIKPALLAIQLFDQYLYSFENFIRNRPGVLDTPLIDAMNRLSDRLKALKAAYDRHDTADLTARAESLDKDEGVKTFYRGLPAATNVTRMIGRLAVTTIAALATGGVGGLITGGARMAATGITLRGALTFAGTAVLEAATFTVVNAALSKAVFDDKISFGSLLKDFAWNVGLFFLLKGLSGISEVMLRSAELEILNAPVQLVAGFPLSYGYGVLRFRMENGRMPKKAELDQMTAESVIMLAAIVVGTKATQRWIAARKTATSLSLLYREYGWRFEALDSLRADLAENIKKAETAGKGSDPAALDDAKAKAKALEQGFQGLLDEVINKDKRFQVPKIREELNALRQSEPDAAAEILYEALGIPGDVGLRKAGRFSYTYASAKTSVLEDALSGQYTVSKASDPVSGVKTITAKSRTGGPDLIFQERTAGALDLDTGVYDIQKLMLDFSLTDPDAQKMLWRMLSDNGVAKDPRQATTTTRAQVKELAKKAGKSAEDTLRDLHKTGRVRSTASKAVVEAADRLQSNGILKSPEWLEARGTDNQRGVVGEWLAKETVAPPASGRIFRRVTVQADLFEDAAGTIPAKGADGNPRVRTTAAETDLVYAHDAAGNVEVDSVINVKASAEKGMSKSATTQNANFEAVLRSNPGDFVKIQLADGQRYARITGIRALEGGATVDLTGKLKPAATVALETVGPKGAAGFKQTVGLDKGGITAVSEVLNESQLIGSGEY